MCMDKFFCLLPLRTGNKILAYAGIVISVAILIFFAYLARETSLEYRVAILTGNYGLEYAPGEERLSKEEEKMAFTLGYYYILSIIISYYFVYMMFIIFSVFLAIGAHHEKRGLLNAYFVYGFIHCCLCLFLALLHYYIREYVEAGFLIASDVLFLLCLCGVKGLINSISSGHVYAHYENGVPIKA